MLGSLGKWLRLLGYDTVIARDEPDAVLVRQARAEDRVILTRDRQLARRRGVRVFLITEDDLEAQLYQVATNLDLPPPQPGSRCPECNELLVIQRADDVAGDVAPLRPADAGQFSALPGLPEGLLAGQPLAGGGGEAGGLERLTRARRYGLSPRVNGREICSPSRRTDNSMVWPTAVRNTR